MNHAAALGNTADVAGMAIQLELHRHFLHNRIGGHDALSSSLTAVHGQALCQGRQTGSNGIDRKGLANDTGGSHDHVLGLDVQLLCHQIGHSFRNLNAVGIAGIGVAGVADHSLGNAVGNMVLGHNQRSALHQIGGVDSRCAGGNSRQNQRQILLAVILTDAAMDAIGGESLCGTNAAFNHFHNSLLM